MTEDSLLSGMAAMGPEEARAVADRHGAWLLEWFRRRVDAPGDAEDLAQEALLVLLRRPRRLRRPERVGAFLLGTARRLVAAHARGQQRRREVEASGGARDAGTAAAHPELAAAILALPEELQQVVAVYYSEDVTYEQAAEILGVPRATVQSQLRRALRFLRAELIRDEGSRR